MKMVHEEFVAEISMVRCNLFDQNLLIPAHQFLADVVLTALHCLMDLQNTTTFSSPKMLPTLEFNIFD